MPSASEIKAQLANARAERQREEERIMKELEEAERRRNKEFRKYVGDRWSELAGWTEDQDKRNVENVGWFEKVTIKLVTLEEKVDRVLAMLVEMKKNSGGAENAEGAEDAEGDEDETMKE